MKVFTQRVIIIQEDGLKPMRFTDPSKAAECWARGKEQEWIEKNKGVKKYISSRLHPNNTLFNDARIRYRKMKRRAQRIFRKILNVPQ